MSVFPVFNNAELESISNILGDILYLLYIKN